MDKTDDFELRSTTKWVKGELHDSLTSATVDPKRLIGPDAAIPPFSRTDWFQRVAKHWHQECRPLVAHAWNEGHHCWLFLVHGEGGEMEALANWYSLAFRPVFSGEVEPDLLFAMARRLKTSKAVPAKLMVAPVPRADGSSDLLIQAFRKAGWIAYRHQSSTSWTANVAGKSFDEYWAERPGQLRSTLQRKAKKAAISCEILTRFDDAAWEAYENVYGDSWKAAEGSPAFLREMAESEAAAGTLRLGLALYDRQVVATQFWTVNAGTAYIHKLAHREDMKEFSPGTILSAAMFRHVIDQDKVSIVDFGTGNDGYKADWMDGSAPLDTIRFYKPGSIAGLTGAARAKLSALVHKTVLD